MLNVERNLSARIRVARWLCGVIKKINVRWEIKKRVAK